MSWLRWAGFCWAAVVAAGCACAGETFLEVEKDDIRSVIELGYRLDPRLDAEIARLAAEHPDSPAPDLLNVGRLYWMQSYVGVDAALSAEFEAEAERALKKAQGYAREHPKSADARFAVAMAEIILVMHYVDHRRWWAAFWKTRPSMRAMRRLLADDPGYADAALALGMANCYLSDAPGYLKPLALLMRFQGDMENGLAYMEQSKRDGLFTAVDARYYLATIHEGLRGDPEAARAELEELARRFPENPKFQVELAEAERACGMHRGAFDRMRRLLKRPEIGRFPALRIEGTLNLCWSALSSGEFAEAKAAGERAERFAREHAALGWLLGWAVAARAEAANALGDPEGAVALFESVGRENEEAHRHARRRIDEIRAATRG